MKILKRLDLKEMAKTMKVIPESELNSIVGAYDGDCFWRCVAYLSSGSSSEAAAASYALNYHTSYFGCSVSADYSLSTYGAGMSIANARSYVQGTSMAGNIVYFYPSDISAYRNAGYESMAGGGVHYAVAIGNTLYDPQLGRSFTILPSDSHKFTRIR